jgi:hypothetical protein
MWFTVNSTDNPVGGDKATSDNYKNGAKNSRERRCDQGYTCGTAR